MNKYIEITLVVIFLAAIISLFVFYNFGGEETVEAEKTEQAYTELAKEVMQVVEPKRKDKDGYYNIDGLKIRAKDVKKEDSVLHITVDFIFPEEAKNKIRKFFCLEFALIDANKKMYYSEPMLPQYSPLYNLFSGYDYRTCVAKKYGKGEEFSEITPNFLEEDLEYYQDNLCKVTATITVYDISPSFLVDNYKLHIIGPMLHDVKVGDDDFVYKPFEHTYDRYAFHHIILDMQK